MLETGCAIPLHSSEFECPVASTCEGKRFGDSSPDGINFSFQYHRAVAPAPSLDNGVCIREKFRILAY